MNILSLGAGACSSEVEIARKNPQDTVTAIDSKDDYGVNDKFRFGKDVGDNAPENLFLIEGDYYSEEFLEQILKLKGRMDLILMSFPHTDQLFYPRGEKNTELNTRLVESIYNLLKKGGKFVMTSDRNDQKKSLEAFLKWKQIDLGSIPVGANFDYTGVIKSIAEESKLFDRIDLVDGALDEVEVDGRKIHLYPELGAAYKLFKEYFEFKILILSKFDKNTKSI